MSRSLRPRKERPDYALLVSGDPNAAAGPSNATNDAGSDFAPEGDEDALGSEDDEREKGVDPNEEGDYDEELPKAPRSTAGGKGKAAAKARTPISAPDTIERNVLTLLPEHASHRQMYHLPQPSVNHRHKAIPIFRSEGGLTERLVRAPVLFGPNETVRTNGYTSAQRTTDRLNKALGYNVGPGPFWSLCEDRGWYKEGRRDADNVGEAARRPRVYEGVGVHHGWNVLNTQTALPYLPAEPSSAGASTLTCDFGPFEKQTTVEMRTLDTVDLSRFFPESRSHVFYVGAPVLALDWCPIFIDDRPYCSHKHFLAVAPLPSKDHAPRVGRKAQHPAPAHIQIWSFGPSQAPGYPNDPGTMRCELILCVDVGPALELRWCPLPSNDTVPTSTQRRLGLLAGTFEDGSLSVYAVPYPADFGNDGKPPYIHLGEPAVRIELEDTACWSLDWASSEVLAIGCTNGVIAVYDVGSALRAGYPVIDLLPTHYMHIHQSAIHSISWVRAPQTLGSGAPDLGSNPTVIASGGHDGLECLTDIRDPSGNTMNRTRDVIPCIPYSPYAGGPITIDHENIVKAYSVSPSMLGRGHMLLEPTGPVWSASASDYHPQLAVGSADGSLLTTNMLRSARRGGAVPFLQHQLFQLDYNRATGAFRMLERFLPRETPDRSAMRGRAPRPPAQESTGAWPAAVGVMRVAWHQGAGLGAAGIVASATAAGLCRVDCVEGRWMKGYVPYGGVAGIRGEEGGMDVDDEDEDE
ncbi:hypothetical protein K488DRAFT_45316 [Vararia minispora EC-137]|uniref:Uncharacterized protein n=1 Tax=Vararia minispora EC-137 TaxID=1314806 RepID=A0ACB8QSL0_9AGAM|nr:hypothetical protein K488DRAFT_45316 [Vararia minispora EC-137]